MDEHKLSIAQHNVARSHTFLNNLSLLDQKKIDLYVICEAPQTISQDEIGLRMFRTKSASTLIILINDQLTVDFVEAESNHYVTTVYLPSHKLKIHSIYHPPHRSKYALTAEPFVTKVLSKVSRKTLVLGDFNATVSLLGDDESERGIKYTELLLAHEWSLLNLPNFPTRKAGSTAIDWSICSNDLINHFQWSIFRHDKSLSDHHMIIINSDYSQSYEDRSRVSTFVNIAKFLEHIKTIDSTSLITDFFVHLELAVELSISIKRKKRKQDFFNEKCMLSRAEVRRLLRKKSRHGKRFPEIAAQLEAANKIHERNVQEAKDLHWINQIRKCRHVGDVFVMIRRHSVKSLPVTSLTEEDCRISDPAAVSERVLNHFYPQDTQDVNLNIMKSHGERDNLITAYEVHKAVCNQNTNSPGHDKVNRYVILSLHQQFPSLLLNVFNYWYEAEQMPSSAKKAIITLILKNKEGSSTLNNLRPISLLSIVAKLYERIIADRILWTIERNNSLHPSQFGFKKGSSIESAVIKIHEARVSTPNAKNTIIALDVSGAFDNVTHQAIIRECINLKLTRSLINIIIDYLSGRQVCLSLHPSYCVLIKKGVPQGSVLGPLLFSIAFSFFLENLTRLLNLAKIDASVVAFADDCTIILRHSSNMDALTSTLHWLISQSMTILGNIGLKLNLKKVQIIDSNSDTPLSINNTVISPVRSARILGVVFQSYGCFMTHVKQRIEAVQVKTSVLIGYLKSGSLSLKSRHALVNSAIYSAFTYSADTILSKPLSTDHFKLILAADKSICVALYGLSSWASYRSVLSIMGRNSLLYAFYRHATRRRLHEANNLSAQYEQRIRRIGIIHPSSRILLGFDKIHRDEQVHSPQNIDIALFTDGSKVHGEYCTTAAVVTWDLRNNEKCHYQFKLPSFATSYQCERHAIFKAVTIIDELFPSGSYRILSDSRSALDAITSTSIADEVIYEIVHKIHQCIRNGKLVKLTWVKAHSTIVGNQLADDTCHEARSNCLVEEFVLHPSSDLGAEVTRQTDLLFLQATSHLFTADANYVAFDALSFHHHRIYLDFYMAAILSARIPTRALLKRLKLSEYSTCECGSEQTVRHLLLYCPLILGKFADKFKSSGLASFISTPRSEDEIFSSLQFVTYLKKIARNLISHLETVNGHSYNEVKSGWALGERDPDASTSAAPPRKKKRT